MRDSTGPNVAGYLRELKNLTHGLTKCGVEFPQSAGTGLHNLQKLPLIFMGANKLRILYGVLTTLYNRIVNASVKD
jgi:hypothetical protein